MAQWAETCIWWHAYPLGATGAPVRPDAHAGVASWVQPDPPRLRRLLPWLDHVVDLGCNGLLLGPVFASTSHGYDTTDHLRVDPRLGTEADLADLLDAAHARGVHVALDGVFNHVGEEHPRFAAARAEGLDSAAGAWFAVDRDTAGRPQARLFEGHASLVTLNHANPEVADHVVDVMTTWLDRGVDAWRLDAAYAVDPAFWRTVLPRVRERHPEAWFIAEAIHGDPTALTADGGPDSVTQYELWKAIWSSLVDRNFFELDWTLGRHNGFLEHLLPQTFVGNHDVTRIASRVGTDGAVLALAVLMTVGGVPSVYAGDELGATGVKEDRLGGDDAVRPELPAAPAEAPGAGGDLHRAHRELIGLRRRHPWLVSARTGTHALTNTRYVYRSRAADGSDAVVVELDVTGAPRVRITDDAGAPLWEWTA